MPAFQSFTLIDATHIDMLYIVLAAIFMPGIIGLLLEVIALCFPDDGYVLSEPGEYRQLEPNSTERDGHDWRRAA